MGAWPAISGRCPGIAPEFRNALTSASMSRHTEDCTGAGGDDFALSRSSRPGKGAYRSRIGNRHAPRARRLPEAAGDPADVGDLDVTSAHIVPVAVPSVSVNDRARVTSSARRRYPWRARFHPGQGRGRGPYRPRCRWSRRCVGFPSSMEPMHERARRSAGRAQVQRSTPLTARSSRVRRSSRAYSCSVRVLGLSSRAAALWMAVGALLGLLYVWRPWQGHPDPCTTLANGTRACMPMIVVPPPVWAYFTFACGGAIAALLVVAAVLHVRRRSP